MSIPAPLPAARAWVLTDGKAGDEEPCLGLLEALGVAGVERRRVAPRAPFAWLSPRGPIDPREAPDRPGSPIAPPYPDLVVAAGRRSLPYLARVRRAAPGVFTVFLRDPRLGAGIADFVWVATHDRLRGANVLATPTGPHRVSPARLAHARAAPDPRLADLPRPRVAVLVGGDNRHGPWREADTRALLAGLHALAVSGAGLMATASRRTPADLRRALADLVAARGGFLWDGSGEGAGNGGGANPYLALLALADAVVATSDSANMVVEALATGAPLHLYRASNTYARHDPLFAHLRAEGLLKPFAGNLEPFRPKPLDATAEIASAVAAAYERRRTALASTARTGS